MNTSVASARPKTRSRRAVPVVAAVVSASVAALVGSSLSASSASAAATNLTVNGGFESGTTGWFVSSGTGSALSLAAGHSGSNAARVSNTSTGSKTVALNDSVNTVASTKKGTTYTATASVRLTKSGATAGLRVMEYNGSSLKGQQQSQLNLSDTSWHTVTLSYTAASDGASLDLNALGWALPSGGAVDVDDLTLVAGGTVSAPTPTPTPAPTTPATGWRQVWADEFNDTAVDTSKWRVHNNEHTPNETSCQTNRSQNVSESGGVLHIKAQREKYTCSGYTAAWTSGYLDTIGKMSQTYGRFEMRAKLPTAAGTSKGMWPAFWLRPNDGGNGEIDVMEAIGGAAGAKNYNRVSQTLWYDYSGSHPRQNYSYVLPGSTMSDAFHTYTVEWEPGVMRWYVDGVLTWSRDSSIISWINDSAFKKPYNIRLNLQVGGSWPGSPDSSTSSTQDYQVDYVRVYQR
ncbi:carbohydrate binding protein [Motilibacter peucedani]|uniref:Carbohydrate binding protein n=1 Tax=Motilibacter peucedani TaxID=598650 RepID=A0A420XLY7_9ACTN|nr:family 16 glycosylhydrolase [Motilibacter peucedani]RKS71331.1 carbohydrate binding protein [Motilibacter peucedani]